jgi:hypothetical protein
MGRVAASQKQRKRDEAHKAQKHIQEAITEYRHQEKLNPAAKPNMSAIARDFGVSYASFRRQLDNHYITMADFNAQKQKIPQEGELEIVNWCIRVAEQNLPMDRTLLLEYANQVLQSFSPGAKLGVSWPDRFLDRHKDRISRQWTRPRDRVRAASSTKEAMDGYFAAYKSIVGENGEKIPPHRQFAFDETGQLRGYNQPWRCFVGHTVVRQVRNKGSSRELITFVPLISGDGKLLDSLVIFPGANVQHRWVENNPNNFLYV